MIFIHLTFDTSQEWKHTLTKRSRNIPVIRCISHDIIKFKLNDLFCASKSFLPIFRVIQDEIGRVFTSDKISYFYIHAHRQCNTCCAHGCFSTSGIRIKSNYDVGRQTSDETEVTNSTLFIECFISERRSRRSYGIFDTCLVGHDEVHLTLDKNSIPEPSNLCLCFVETIENL